MADRDRSFFGPVLAVRPDAPEGFSEAELVRIRGEQCAVEFIRAASHAWPETRRFKTLRPEGAYCSNGPSRSAVVAEGGTMRTSVTVVVRDGGTVRTFQAP